MCAASVLSVYITHSCSTHVVLQEVLDGSVHLHGDVVSALAERQTQRQIDQRSRHGSHDLAPSCNTRVHQSPVDLWLSIPVAAVPRLVSDRLTGSVID